jgi:2-polyprenyl-3-methyl-5-hydroxy-6-metoxy-1,4-benzoquinol methylase
MAAFEAVLQCGAALPVHGKEVPVAIRIDPENSETRALFELVEFGGKHVLEIGCGDGRLTWRYADRAEHVTAIEPDSRQIALAIEQLPEHLQRRIEFHNITFEGFAAASPSSAYDIIILSWSLC